MRRTNPHSAPALLTGLWMRLSMTANSVCEAPVVLSMRRKLSPATIKPVPIHNGRPDADAEP